MRNIGEPTRPGTKAIKGGLLTAMIGVLFTIVIVANGGNLVALWLVAIGLVVAAIGFGVRVLAALERR